MGWNRSYNQGDALPVERVSWNDCQEFIAKIQRFATEGYRFRLPNEDEWEYACRAGTATRYAFGDAWNDAFANNGGGTLPCGSYSFANAWGLKDMHGNVWEWCEDLCGDHVQQDGVERRILRGGGWGGGPINCRATGRSYLPAAWGTDYIGFRLVLSEE